MIPIFRAKRLYSDEYVFGVPRQDSKGTYEMIINVVEDGIAGVIQRYIKVDTLSIHFPNMLDSQGNKIFASLSENKKGGDILIEEGRYEDGFNPIFEPYFSKSSLSIFDLPKTPYGEYQLKYYKIIGIQE